MKPLSTVLIGLGRIGWMLERDKLRYHPCTHAGALRALNHSGRQSFELTGICDLQQDRIEQFLRWWKAPVAIGSVHARTVLRAAKPDLVIISASLPAHRGLVQDALREGCKAIVLEKPPAESLSDTERMLRLSGTVPVWVNYERRYHPYYRRVKTLIDAGGLGAIRSIHGRVLVGHSPGAGESGPLLHDASHWIDLLIWFAGLPRGVAARLMSSRNGLAEHTAFVQFHYDDFTATLESGGRRKYFEFEMQIDFERGRILCGNSGLRVFKSAPSKRYAQFLELKEIKTAAPAWRNPWLQLYSEVLRGVRGKCKPSSSIESAAEGMQVVDRILKSGAKAI